MGAGFDRLPAHAASSEWGRADRRDPRGRPAARQHGGLRAGRVAATGGAAHQPGDRAADAGLEPRHGQRLDHRDRAAHARAHAAGRRPASGARAGRALGRLGRRAPVHVPPAPRRALERRRAAPRRALRRRLAPPARTGHGRRVRLLPVRREERARLQRGPDQRPRRGRRPRPGRVHARGRPRDGHRLLPVAGELHGHVPGLARPDRALRQRLDGARPARRAGTVPAGRVAPRVPHSPGAKPRLLRGAGAARSHHGVYGRGELDRARALRAGHHRPRPPPAARDPPLRRPALLPLRRRPARLLLRLQHQARALRRRAGAPRLRAGDRPQRVPQLAQGRRDAGGLLDPARHAPPQRGHRAALRPGARARCSPRPMSTRPRCHPSASSTTATRRTSWWPRRCRRSGRSTSA